MRLRIFLMSLFLVMSAHASWSMGSIHPATTATNSDPLIGKQAPDVILERNIGDKASVLSLRNGKKAILVFWTTWCPHCHEELARISDKNASVEEKGIKIILVDVGETKAEVNAYLQREGVSIPSFIDEENALQEPYNLVGVPTLVFIDEKGIIRDIEHEFPVNYEELFKK